ncbi:MAG: hypothetical protein ACO1SX_22660 [Actinomycetota bacterium]
MALLAGAGSVQAQSWRVAPQLDRLQVERKAQRSRAEGLRAEVKRQQRLVGELRNRVGALEGAAAERDQEIARLTETARTQRIWLYALGALLGILAIAALARRPAEPRAAPALLAARERNVRLRDEMSALDARIRAAERQGTQGVE